MSPLLECENGCLLGSDIMWFGRSLVTLLEK